MPALLNWTQAGVFVGAVRHAGTGAEAPLVAQRQVAVRIRGGGGEVERVADVDDPVGRRAGDAADGGLVADRAGIAEDIEFADGGQIAAVIGREGYQADKGRRCWV